MEDCQASAQQMMQDAREKTILDLRRPEDCRLGACPEAVNLWWKELERILEADGGAGLSIPRDRPVYLICYTGETSDEFAQLLRKLGYEAYSLAGGFRSYVRWRFAQGV